MTASTVRTDRQSSKAGEYRTYAGADSDMEDHRRAYAAPILREAREIRRLRRARTNARIRSVPAVALHIGAGAVGLTGTVVLLCFSGLLPAVSLPAGAAFAGLYAAAADMRRSLVTRDSGWRDRHRIIAWMVPRHPLDCD